MNPVSIESLPEEELMTPGHLGCQGCGAALGMRHVLKALGEKTIIVLPACCWSIIAGPFPYSAVKVPVLHTAFETAASTACGVRAALDVQHDRETTVLAWAGDGGTFDIGLQALSGVAERNENILYVCYDNEAYMNTGIQRSSATPSGAWTTTTPGRKEHPKKDIMQIMAAHRIPYAATASVAYPEDLFRKVRKARSIQGTRFIQLLTPCPPGWKIAAELSVRLARLAVLSRVFPLYEIEEGSRYTLSAVENPEPVTEYLKAQGRFHNLTSADFAAFQEEVDRSWARLRSLAADWEAQKA
ncbi:MAG: 3-methyl-2-oxobutanoate dehydrogenase subunit beta [Acidobacteriota bacterium]|jgi:pyruvate/2-oxoacid:ferredoxin oxidoreductase beta subunit